MTDMRACGNDSRVDLMCSEGHGFAFIMGNKGAEFVGVVPRV